MSDSPRVVYWNNIPAPYMVERFNAVAARNNVHFEAWFSEFEVPERTWRVDSADWQFRYRRARTRRIGGTLIGLPPRQRAGARPSLIFSLYAEAPYVAGVALSRSRGVRTALWVEVTYDSWVRRTWVKEGVKRRVLGAADAVVTVGQDGRAYARRYGVRDDRIHYLPHAIDAARFAGQAASAARERDALRRDLGLRGVTFLYVGRLWSGKGLDDLITAFAASRTAAGSEISLLLVGDGPEEVALRERCAAEGLGNVSFVGFRQQDDLAAYYAAADVFVFPTLGDPYGLVVDEAMACSLPVVSSAAAGEIRRRVTDGVTGFVVAPGDATSLAARMVQLASDPELRRELGSSAERRVAWQSPDAWARQFECVVNEILRA